MACPDADAEGWGVGRVAEAPCKEADRTICGNNCALFFSFPSDPTTASAVNIGITTDSLIAVAVAVVVVATFEDKTADLRMDSNPAVETLVEACTLSPAPTS